MKSCSSYDLKAFFFGELTAEHRSAVEQHAAACASCREELASLDLTRTQLLALADEEPPRRIAFVSDRVFEPSWWQRLWSSGPRLGFASAAMLAAAILAHGFLASPRPLAPVAQQAQSAPVDRGAVEAAVRAELSKQFDAAVKQAAAVAEDRQAAKLLDIVNERVNHSERRLKADILMIQDYLVRQQKESALTRRAAYYGESR